MSDSCSPSGCHANFPPIEPTKTAVNAELADYWNTLYSVIPAQKMDWFESDFSDSIKLIEEAGIAKNDHVLLAGCGSSGLIAELLNRGYSQISAVDISQVALDDLKDGLGDLAAHVNIINTDFTNDKVLTEIPEVDLWFDRMLLHHFVELNDQKTYLNTIATNLSSKGKMVVIENSLRGNNRSAGLPVKQLSSLKLKALFPAMELKTHFEKEHLSPSGKKNYLIYGVFNSLT